MKTVFARLAILWLLVGQLFAVGYTHFRQRPPSRVEMEYARDKSPANQAALERELARNAEYEAARDIGLITFSLAVDGVLIACFWNYGKRTAQPEIAPS